MSYRRIVIKIGSSSLTHNGGRINLNRIDHFLRQMVDLKTREGSAVCHIRIYCHRDGGNGSA